ncbi:unnamed protein product [Cercospora beticola]|nr:unnamed protein product [Cercospora beticola]
MMIVCFRGWTRAKWRRRGLLETFGQPVFLRTKNSFSAVESEEERNGAAEVYWRHVASSPFSEQITLSLPSRVTTDKIMPLAVPRVRAISSTISENPWYTLLIRVVTSQIVLTQFI